MSSTRIYGTNEVKRRPSKILPNNSPIAVAARGGEVLESHVEPPQPLRGFKPWSREQPAYYAWFKATMEGEPCQCDGRWCSDVGTERHHELRGTDKDDRTIVWLSRVCHHEVRHHRGCPELFALLCRALAGDNWRAYEDTLEPRGTNDLATQMESAEVGSEGDILR